jgi:peptidoglycan hydrolase-like protein with peptidoglycan-binding domain
MGQGDAATPDEINQQREKHLLTEIQRGLIRQGLLPPGEPDGLMTQQTEDAIRAFQKKAGLHEDGASSKALLDKIRESAKAAN